MIGRILKLGVLLLIGIVSYNYFFGTPQEKAKSKEIIDKVSDIGKAGVGLIQEEYDKFKSGKYDDALDKIGSALSSAKDKIEDKGGKLMTQISEWQDRKKKWEEEKSRLEDMFDTATDEEKEKLKDQIKSLNDEGKKLEQEGKKLTREME